MSQDLRSMSVPRGHPGVRSFLGLLCLIAISRCVVGLLLGHTEPNRFAADDEMLLVGLAAQAAVGVGILFGILTGIAAG